VLNAVPTTGGTFSGNVLFASGNGIWNTSGNVGVGTSSPGYKLQVNRTGNGAAARFTNGSTIIDLWNDSTSSYIGDAGAVNALEVNTASNSATLNTNNSQRLLIDSSGRVTMPFQSGFAYLSAAVTYATGGNQVVFSGGTYNYNIGSMLNLTGGTGGASRATIPVSGYYYVGVSLMGENDGSRIEAFLQQNGSNILGVNSESTQYNNANINAIVYFAANDYIEIRRSTGTLYTGATNADIFFTIRLLG